MRVFSGNSSARGTTPGPSPALWGVPWRCSRLRRRRGGPDAGGQRDPGEPHQRWDCACGFGAHRPSLAPALHRCLLEPVKVEGIRYIAARNEAEAKKDAADRAAIIEALDQQVKRGDKARIGTSAYRRYLRTTKKQAFEIDIGKIAEQSR